MTKVVKDRSRGLSVSWHIEIQNKHRPPMLKKLKTAHKENNIVDD